MRDPQLEKKEKLLSSSSVAVLVDDQKSIAGASISQAYFGGCDLPERNKRSNMKYNCFKGIELSKIFFNFPKCPLIITTSTMGYLILKVYIFCICGKYVLSKV